jgi:hypothetical protein
MIPKSFKLVNRTFTVERMSDTLSKAGSMDGEFNLKHGTIKVGSSVSTEYDEHTYYHELVHALLESSSRPGLSKKEPFVDSLAGVLHQYMQTKKGEFKWEERHMFKLIVIVLLLLILAAVSACTPAPTLRELQAEALITGDWTAVEKREERWAYKEAMDAASRFCRGFSDGGFLLCVDLPRRQKLADIPRYCGCSPAHF